MTKLASGLPKDTRHNGLARLAPQMLRSPKSRHLMLAVVDCSKITEDVTSGEHEPTARVLRIEKVHPDDMAEAERLVRRALEHRSGDTVLPIDLERDIEDWIGQGYTIDLATGEILPVADQLQDDPGEDA
ncbi:MAG: hypothetical protein LBU50_03935 [Cellulomonas sp.]|jgi:hypothetical protein|nr:hypothetical protein [Cellulomonas sp.]